jgi:hypothetical protein
VAIPASPSAQAEKEPVKKILATSSRTLLKLLHKQDHLTAFSRMFMATFLSGSTRYLAKWDHLITPQRHLLFQLRVSAPTKEIDSGSSARTWPTPTTKGFGHASEGQTLIMRDLVERGELTEEEAQAMMNGTTLRPPRMKEWLWPTPTAGDHSRNTVPPSIGKTRGYDLSMKVVEVEQQMFQTPTAMDHLPPRNEEALKKQYMKNRQGRSEHSTLREQVVYPKPQKMWPTPRASIGMNMSLSENMAKLRHKRYLETEMAYEIHKEKLWSTPSASLGKHSYNGNNEYYENRIEKGRQTDLAVEIYQKEGLGKLSPSFVEYLMGFPDGWTNPDISNEQLIRMNTEQKD